MRKELQEKLFKKYPKIFRRRKLSVAETCMCWGIDCADGWYSLIDNLCFALQIDIDEHGEKQIEVEQVKEKFGGLRFYINSGSELQHALIAFCENLSLSICEECGSMNNVKQTKGWIYTRCSDCMKKLKK